MERRQPVGHNAGRSPGTSAAPQQVQRERDALREQRLALERERTSLEEFAAMAAHEVLKPLVLTESCATAIGERAGDRLDPESRRDLETLLRVSSRMRIMVEGLLLDARDQDEPLRRQRVDLTTLVNDCVEMQSAEIRARHAHVDVDPLPVVRGNAALLQGVFGNLLSNALSHGLVGGHIRVTATRESAGWVFGVESPGPPIPESERQRIFEPWQRGRNARGSRGAGLGLAIVRRIVERHGGEVGVTSPTGRGNRIFFTLPT